MKKSLLISVLAAAILLVGVVAYATADPNTVTATGSPLTATDTVTVSADISPLMTLTVDAPDTGQTVAFGTVAPGDTPSKNVGLEVKSNLAYDLTASTTGADAAMGLTTSGIAVSDAAATASQSYTDTYALDVPWTTAPGSYTAQVTYTLMEH
jgi:hypothetical protein